MGIPGRNASTGNALTKNPLPEVDGKNELMKATKCFLDGFMAIQEVIGFDSYFYHCRDVELNGDLESVLQSRLIIAEE